MTVSEAAGQSEYGMAVLELGNEVLVRQEKGFFATPNGDSIMVERATDRPSKFSTWRPLMPDEHMQLRQAIEAVAN